ncbi:MAG: hypothetical protein KAJ10_12925 [Thermodesulfovibrionia bacterium]|nr:hypothetical protein [Thermodesulfovibrionia bacterium]
MMKRMKKLRRFFCALFGHQHELVREDESFCLYTCKRCGQTSWFIKRDGVITEYARWDRVLTNEEIQVLFESAPLTYDDILEDK